MPSGPTKPQVPNLGKLLLAVSKTLEEALDSEATNEMQRNATAFQERIKRQEFISFEKNPLSWPWLKRKRAKGADERVMIATATYVNGIKVFSKRMDGRRRQYRIGFNWSAKARTLDNKVSPILLHDLGVVQEHGSMSQNIPARPHWKPFSQQTFTPNIRKWRKQVPARVLAKVASVHGDSLEISI